MNFQSQVKSITISTWQPRSGNARYYVNGINRPKMYLTISSDGSRVVWSSAHKDRSGKTSSDWAAIKKDEAAWTSEVRPAILAMVGKDNWSDVTIEDIEAVAK